MEHYELAALTITEAGTPHPLSFARAKLTVVSEYGTRLWYVDLDGIADLALLRRFAEAEDIGISLSAVTIGGKAMSGRGFLHPNPLGRSAAIRGDGELEGYGQNG
ncbi:hypothetical protein [Cohnella caldifontis]|uniref:hypothetical protein n=1 Tax=Cohnella caldifontis TaxID=3027471 RepID=UPI0023ED4901|nr:hypothetical protein [Cohnella sp. YIM B05605]